MGNAARTPLKQYLEAGRLEAGCDEAGRGCPGRPCDMRRRDSARRVSHPLLADSKKMTAGQRAMRDPS